MFRFYGFSKLAFIVVGVFCLSLQAAAPKGWILAGSDPADYETGIDAQSIYKGHASAYLKGAKPEPKGFGTLMQQIGAENYLGKRVRFSASVKAENVQGWAGLWLRVDKGSTPVAFDNMQNRPIKGTGDWQNYQVVLDVPPDATGIAFGTLLSGKGNVWLNAVTFEVVGTDVPTTDMGSNRPSAPVNLGFKN